MSGFPVSSFMDDLTRDSVPRLERTETSMQWLQLGLTVLSTLSSIASICGLYYALRAVRESKEQTAKLKDLVERQTISQDALIHVSKSLTTRYAGIHPEYITEVQKIVESAKESILVMSSVSGFGIFSSARGWEELRAGLMRAKMTVTITLLTGSVKSLVERIQLQFATAYSDWEGWLALDDNRAMLRDFCSCYGLTIPTAAQAEWLEGELIRINDEIRQTVYRGNHCVVKVTDDFLPVIAWIADGRRAIFAFSNEHGKYPGFYTEDHYIIESLTGFANRIIKACP
jgi:hypothetical protein